MSKIINKERDWDILFANLENYLQPNEDVFQIFF